MRKFVRKKLIKRYCAVICSGMLIFTGCADTETKPEVEKTEVTDNNHQDSNDENNTTPMNETVPGDSKDGNSDDYEKKAQEQDDFVDANDLMASADLVGSANECSDIGCIIALPYATDDPAPNEVGGSVVYKDDTVFQKGTVKSDGSSYSLEDSDKSELKNDDFVLCFGNQQADGSYLADTIIMITFDYN